LNASQMGQFHGKITTYDMRIYLPKIVPKGWCVIRPGWPDASFSSSSYINLAEFFM
jgi:hypothetical protein